MGDRPPVIALATRSVDRSATRLATAATRITALVAVLFVGGCVTGEPHDAVTPSVDAPPLSVSLARFRAPSAGAAGSPVAGALADATNRRPGARSAPRDAPVRPPPRALDPIPPLYVPPSRAPALQPILDVPLAASPGPRPRPSRALRPGTLDARDPLRRIDPVSGRDPLGRLDPSGGVDLAGTLAR